ncbi:hypothetical protein D1224_07915 [Henriciella barbarensis]|uniref:Uncharacterized protein n=1 Tax=Henriciella barbarensis TaxID=86342 RepID=A0A399R1R4_9PROT|nr:DUF6768 family protein [Henriciella barbarensis]RIJ24155.1 hypothetical protein D1224_07915 [Henriciella barbarensis]
MTGIDEKIRQGMNEDDRAFLASLDAEPGLFQQMGAAFAGTMKLWTVFAVILSLVFFGLSIWSVFAVFNSETPVEAIGWAGIGLAGFMATGFVKIWFWLRMNHLTLLREMKIIELRLESLNAN